jgi:hypothetical protein
MPLFVSLLPLRTPPEEKKKLKEFRKFCTGGRVACISSWAGVVAVCTARVAVSAPLTVAAVRCVSKGSAACPAASWSASCRAHGRALRDALLAVLYTTLPAVRHSGQISCSEAEGARKMLSSCYQNPKRGHPRMVSTSIRKERDAVLAFPRSKSRHAERSSRGRQSRENAILRKPNTCFECRLNKRRCCSLTAQGE